MELVKVENFRDVYNDADISMLMNMCLNNPSLGRLQNIAQSLYAKQQGLLYKAVIDGETIGIIGVKKIDNDRLELYHMALKEEHRGNRLSRRLIFGILEAEGINKMFCEADHKIVLVLKRAGFKCKLVEDEMWGSETYKCELSL